MKYYKFLTADGSATHGVGKWNLPTASGPGEWMPDIVGDIVPCENGYHACRPQDVVEWCNDAMYELEFDGEVVIANDKVVGRRARLLRKIDAWDERTARLFAADCAERVLLIFEKERPGDDRPRKAIQAVRDSANGIIDAAAWAAAGAAARAAARDAAWDAERSWQSSRLLEMVGEMEDRP